MMRYWTLALLTLTFACLSCQSQSPAHPTACLKTDPTLHHALYTLSDDPVVKKAVDRHEITVIYVEAEFRNSLNYADTQPQIDALMIDREKQLSALKAQCLAALRRAADVNRSLNHNEKATQIAALADRIAASSDNQRLTDTDYFGLHPKFQDVPNLMDWRYWKDWRDWSDWYEVDW